MAHRLYSTAVLAVLAACGRPQGAHTQIALEVTEGIHAGRYRVSALAETCGWDVPGPGSLAVRYTDLDSAAALASLQLIVPPDTGFYFGVVFGGFGGDRPGYEIETRPNKAALGEGTIVVNRAAAATALDITGRTDGFRFTARVRCAPVDTLDTQ